MPQGPLGVDRPFVTSNIVLNFGLDISDSRLVQATAEERRDIIESSIRENTDMLLDVKFGPSKTFILTRQESLEVDEVNRIADAIENLQGAFNVRVATPIDVVADGE